MKKFFSFILSICLMLIGVFLMDNASSIVMFFGALVIAALGIGYFFRLISS